MEKVIRDLILSGKNASEISKIVGLHRTTIARLAKKLDLQFVKIKHIHCDLCDKHLGENPKNNTRCKTCVTRVRRFKLKSKAVQYKGGKCERCGYKEHLAALQFHHVDSNEKDFAIGSIKNSVSWNVVKKELDKCELLCANCHAIEHSKYNLIN